MLKYMQSVKSERYAMNEEWLNQFLECKDAKHVWDLYDFSKKQQHEYERDIREVVTDYKTGILDPTRLVGRVEMGRTGKG